MLGKPQAPRFDAHAPSRFWRRWHEGMQGLGRTLQAILNLVALAAAGLTGIMPDHDAAAAPKGSRFGPKYFTNALVTTHEGKTVPFYDGLIKGKAVVINFIYLNCNDICPLQTARMAEIRRRLGDAVGHDVFIYSITIDPAHDTPELLKEYADAFGAGGGWLFLTGRPQELDKIRWQLGERSRNLSEHRNDMVLGNDVTGEWSRSSVFEEFDVAVQKIRELDPVYFNTKRKISTDQARSEKGLRLDRQPGEALFLRACAVCHSIGGGDSIGPDLKDIAERRNRDWLTRFLLAPNKMRAEKDPLTMVISERYKGVKMPNLGLEEPDIADLLAYIEVRSKAAEGKATGAEAAPSSRDSGG